MGADENALETPEEAAAYRTQVIARMEAEEQGKDLAVKEPQPAPAQPADEPEQPREDPWQGVPEGVKALYRNLSSKVDSIGSTIGERLKQAENRIGGITNQLSAADRAAQEAEKATKPTQEQIDAAAESDEQWKELKEDFPEWAGALDARMDARFSAFEQKLGDLSAGKDMTAEVEALKTNLEQGTGGAGAQEALLGFFEPGWRETVRSEDYQAWLAVQGNDIKEKTGSDFARDALDVLDAYAVHKGKAKSAEDIASARRGRLRRSLPVKGRPGMRPKAQADMTEAEYRQEVAQEVWAED